MKQTGSIIDEIANIVSCYT